MKNQLVSVGSITFAMKGREILLRQGISAYVERTPKHESNQGCGYSLLIPKDVDKALAILKSNGIKVLGTIDRGESP